MAKITFETEDHQEVLRLIKSDEMANFIWELVHNSWRKFKHTDIEYEPIWEEIHRLLEEHNINIDELTG